MFDADKPIVTSKQDRLERTTFAKYLARCLLDHQNTESLVVGLYGGWGTGKTSVINLALEELNFAASNLLDEEKPIVLNFSPWSYSGQNQLIYSFFRRLSATLRAAPHLENADKIIHLLELYVSFFTNKPIPKPLRTKRTWLERLTLQKKEDIYAWESGRDLTQVKAELNTLLKNQKHKIIIIIDNISRLFDYEIKQVFQIVKSIGDYANTIFILAFDKEHVTRALNKVDGYGGEEYIEKIIQLPFEIPPILQQDLEAIFADKVSSVMKMIPEDAWSNEYWADVYYSSLKLFFDNCRDITRYVNTLGFSYSRVKDVVNPVDFFALTALEVFTPNVYYGIRENKDLFTDLLENVYKLNPAQLTKDRQRCDEIISRSDRIPRDTLISMLVRLFPRLRKLYYPEQEYFHSETMARKLRRVCDADMFDIYFRLFMQTSHLTSSEFDMLLSLSSNMHLFDQAITRLNKDERITKFLDQLDSHVLQTIPKENIPNIITALLDNGDLFPPGIMGSLSLDTPMRIHRIIHALLRRFDNPDERFLILQNAIANTNKSLHTMVYELQEQTREHLGESDTFVPREYRDLTPDQLDSLQKLVANRIQWWAMNGNLINHPHLLSLLYAWHDWEQDNACERFIMEATQTDKGLVTFLLAALSLAIEQIGTTYQKTSNWEKYLENIQLFIPAVLLQDHAKAIFEDPYFEKLKEKEQLAVMIFLDLTNTPTKKIIPKTSV